MKDARMASTVLCIGTIKGRRNPRYGIVLERPVGNMDGTLNNDPHRRYFSCKKNHWYLELRTQIVEINRSLVVILFLTLFCFGVETK